MVNIKSDMIDKLFQSILELKTIDECYEYFQDLCTIKEIQDMALRLECAFLIDQGMKYQEISASTGLSTATISRVSKCLNYGEGGYRKVLDRSRKK